MADEYLLAGQRSELERLTQQARTWEPAGQALLDRIGDGAGLRALDVGCGAHGWLKLLSRWVGEDGEVVGTDVDPTLLAAARKLDLDNVELIEDDLFASRLEPASFDLVHARFQLCPLGRAQEQVEIYAGLTRPGGHLVLEEPDSGSWHCNPPAPATEALIGLIVDAFRHAGGDFDAGRQLPALLTDVGIEATTYARVLALGAGHPYLKLPLQFAASLDHRLRQHTPAAELEELVAAAEEELADPDRWGTTFTLIQAHARP
ncbi:MAG TPA: methyltransferase domain-containing protein [Solirubrobacteraceae bacterium]|jgi:SAM-dependent methyltransferase